MTATEARGPSFTLLARGYATGEQEIVSRVMGTKRQLKLYLQKDGINLVEIGDYVSLYRRDDILSAYKIDLPEPNKLKAFKLHKISSGATRKIGIKEELGALKMGDRTYVQFEPDIAEGVFRLRFEADEKQTQPKQGTSYTLNIGARGELFLSKTLVDAELEGYGHIITYVTKQSELLLKPVSIPDHAGEFLGVYRITLSTESRTLTSREVTLPQSSGLKLGEYVRIRQSFGKLDIEKAPNKDALSVYRFERLQKIHIEHTNRGRYSSKCIMVPKNVVEAIGLKEGDWIKTHLDSEGNAVMEKLIIKHNPEAEFLRISRIGHYEKDHDQPEFIVSKRAVGMLNAYHGEKAWTYLAAGDRLTVFLGKDAEKESARDLRLLGIAKIRHYGVYATLFIPKSAVEYGFDVGNYALMRVDKERRRIILEKADISEGEIPGKAMVDERNRVTITLKENLKPLRRNNRVAIYSRT